MVELKKMTGFLHCRITDLLKITLPVTESEHKAPGYAPEPACPSADNRGQSALFPAHKINKFVQHFC